LALRAGLRQRRACRIGMPAATGDGAGMDLMLHRDRRRTIRPAASLRCC